MEDFNLTDEALQKLLATEPPWIETEADYEAALKRIEALMDAEPGTPEERELNVLAAIVEAYEDEHYALGLADDAEANLDKMVPFTEEMLASAMELIPNELQNQGENAGEAEQ